MTAERVAQLAGPVAAVGIVALYLAPWRHARIAGLLAALAGAGLCVPLLLPDRDRVLLGAAALAGLGVCALVAAVLARWPWALAFLVVVAAPARIPVDVGGEQANLLLPLYAVVGGGVLLLLGQLARSAGSRGELGMLGLPLAAFVAWLCISAAWADDRREASVQLLFFLVPFALLALLVARLPWRRGPQTGMLALLVGLAVVFAGVGIGQWVTREIWWNPKVEVGNAYGRLFRVNGVFWDPSIYGRFLSVAIVAALGVLLLCRVRRPTVLVAAIAVLWVGLLFSYSQSSFVALAAGVASAAALAWRWRALAAVALVAAIAVPVVVFAPQFERVRDAIANDADGASSGRWGLVSTGIDIALAEPATGVGLGSYPVAYAREKGLFDRRGEPRPPAFARSHATPVTVAAEQGAVGFALFLALVGAVAIAAFRWRPDGAPAAATGRLAGLVLCVVFVHSLFYSALLEDPLTWTAVGLVALARAAATGDDTPAMERWREELPR